MIRKMTGADRSTPVKSPANLSVVAWRKRKAAGSGAELLRVGLSGYEMLVFVHVPTAATDVALSVGIISHRGG
jgi:hypothetical protein